MTTQDLVKRRDALRPEILAELVKAHNPELSKIDGKHVTQLWWDGEITSQKGGSLLNQRSLHSFESGFPFPEADILMASYNFHKSEFPDGTGYIFCTSADAHRIRGLMAMYHMIVLAIKTGWGLEFSILEDKMHVPED